MTSSIEGINSNSMMSRLKKISMTNSQKEKAQEIIEKYASEDFTEEDFLAMGKELREAGIRPGEDLKSMLAENGIDVEQYAHKPPAEKPQGGKKPPRPEGGEIEQGLQNLLTLSEETDDTELNSIVEEMLAKYDEDSISEEDQTELKNYLEENYQLLGFFTDKSVKLIILDNIYDKSLIINEVNTLSQRSQSNIKEPPLQNHFMNFVVSGRSDN